MAGMPPPDWDRNKVVSRAYGGDLAKVGDPTRWGGQATLRVTTPPLAGFARYQSPQFLRAQAGDRYGRLWALTGTLKMPALYALAALNEWQAELIITQGVGQTAILQHFNLRLLNNIAFAGGYSAPLPDGGFVSWPFAIIGGVIGQQWGAQLQIFLGGGGVLPAGDHDITCSVISSVLAAGTGL